jgi:hypothetical protein
MTRKWLGEFEELVLMVGILGDHAYGQLNLQPLGSESKPQRCTSRRAGWKTMDCCLC